MASIDLQEIHDFAVILAKEAGKMIVDGSNLMLSQEGFVVPYAQKANGIENNCMLISSR